jgi:hypothetical protein
MAYKVPMLRDVEKDVDPYALEMLGRRFSTATMRRVFPETSGTRAAVWRFRRRGVRLHRARPRHVLSCRFAL